jgi:anti-anti-sigma regulatory factor
MCVLTPAASRAGSWTLALSGSVDGASLPEIGRFIQEGRDGSKTVVLDLGEVTLLDRAAAYFFAEQRRQGVEVVNCPVYIERWISRETHD